MLPRLSFRLSFKALMQIHNYRRTVPTGFGGIKIGPCLSLKEFETVSDLLT